MAALADGVILDDVKQLLMVPEDYDVFDSNITMHINSVFSTLQQLGVGPNPAFMLLTGDETWVEFFGETPERYNLMAVKTYVSLRVRLLFDPPTNSFGVASINEQIKELEWRLTVQAEGISNV